MHPASQVRDTAMAPNDMVVHVAQWCLRLLDGIRRCTYVEIARTYTYIHVRTSGKGALGRAKQHVLARVPVRNFVELF